jgi:hypothetical protein
MSLVGPVLHLVACALGPGLPGAICTLGILLANLTCCAVRGRRRSNVHVRGSFFLAKSLGLPVLPSQGLWCPGGVLLACACRTLQAQVAALQFRLGDAQVGRSPAHSGVGAPWRGWVGCGCKTGGAEGEEMPAPRACPSAIDSYLKSYHHFLHQFILVSEALFLQLVLPRRFVRLLLYVSCRG